MTIPPSDIVTALVEDGCSEFDDTGKVMSSIIYSFAVAFCACLTSRN